MPKMRSFVNPCIFTCVILESHFDMWLRAGCTCLDSKQLVFVTECMWGREGLQVILCYYLGVVKNIWGYTECSWFLVGSISNLTNPLSKRELSSALPREVSFSFNLLCQCLMLKEGEERGKKYYDCSLGRAVLQLIPECQTATVNSSQLFWN